MKTLNKVGFSYYELSLLSFLRLTHPHRVNDTHFIKERADEASNAYSIAIEDGFTPHQAIEFANETLYKGLHFSLHNTIVEILTNEFSALIPLSLTEEFAIKIEPFLMEVYGKYNLADDFAASKEYIQLYTELAGAIQIWIEENGVQ